MKKIKSKTNYTPEMLPATRKAQFFDLVKLNWKLLLLLGVLVLVFSLPMHFVAVYKFVYVSAISGSVTEETDESQIAELQMQINVARNISAFADTLFILIFAVCFAGMQRIFRQLCWGENVYFPYDFPMGIKQNYKQTVFVAFLSATVYALCVLLSNFQNTHYDNFLFVALSTVPIAIALFLLLPIAAYLTVLIPVYGNGFLQNVKIALTVYSKTPFSTLAALLCCGIWYVPLVIQNLICQTFLRIALCFFAPFVMLAWTLFCYNRLDKFVNPQFALAGEGFGKFQKLLQGFDASVLTEPIKNFHNTEARYAAFEQAFQADSLNRAKMCRTEVEFFQSRKDYCRKILDLIDCGSVPLRVTHNDTKPNNVLVDEKNNSAVAVIDLDTVMAGTLLYDFGDSVRYGTNTAAEDEIDLSKVVFSKQMYEAYCKGFLPQVKDVLTEGEKQNMHLGAFLMTYECGMRFLTDFLCGDVYFKISREHHNLDRCRTQIALLRQMEHNVDFMREAVAKSLN